MLTCFVATQVSGKLRAQRAKSMKFKDGFMLKTGDITNYYVNKATAHVKLRQVRWICLFLLLFWF